MFMRQTKKWKDRLSALLGSKNFFYLIICLATLQALWYAFSFVPWVNDEGKHFRTTQIYTSSISPILTTQPESWDDAGQVTRNGSYLFYYLFSWPLRVAQAVTNDVDVQLIFMRLLMIVCFMAALYFYRKALLMVPRVTPLQVNVVLFGFILTPTAGLLAGMYNYDNFALLLFGILLWLSMRIFTDNTVRSTTLLMVALLSGIIVLVKWSAAALVVPLFLSLLIIGLRRHGKKYVSLLWRDFASLALWLKITLILGIVMVSGLIIERPLQNIVTYKNAEPKCDVILSHERCMKFADYANYEATLAAKPTDFNPLPLPAYIVRFWIPHMADKMANLIEKGADSRLPIIAAFHLGAVVSSIIVVIVGWRRWTKNLPLTVFMVVTATLVAALIFQEYRIYTEYGIPGAIRPRYLVPILPLYGLTVLYVLWPLIQRFKRVAVGLAVLVFLIHLQGGGILTHLYTTPQYAYWSSETYAWNERLKSVLDPIVYSGK